MPSSRGVAAAVLTSLLAACATKAPAQPVDLGGGTYSLTKRTGVLVTGSGPLKAEVEQEALAFCTGRGQALSVLDSIGVDPEPPAYPHATVTFRCVPR